ncbi:MAG: hypothetical protein Q4G04_06205 [bacterium]|nr:hypothetical protein [bacterium]
MKRKFVWFLVTFLLLVGFAPGIVKAVTLDELKESKTLTIKSVPLKSAYEVSDVLLELYSDIFDEFWVSNCNDDLTECDVIGTNSETHRNEVIISDLKLIYQYDPDIKAVIENLVSRLTKTAYLVNDIDYFRWLPYSVDSTNNVSLASFSLELKKEMEYNNFYIDFRLGDSFPYYTSNGGISVFSYDDTIYYYDSNPLMVYYDHLFYIDSDSTDVKSTIEARLSTIADNYTVSNTLKTVREHLIELFTDWYNFNSDYYIAEGFLTVSDFINGKMNDSVLAEDAEYAHLKNYLDEEVYMVEVPFADASEQSIASLIIPVKDSTKVTDFSTYVSNDPASGISISTDSVIPIDTLIKVYKITSGEDYEKIVRLLNDENVEIFDLKLFSKSLNQNITRLDDGTFEVKIPINESFKDKDLVVYFLKEDNTFEEYQVTIKDNYAIFYTDHFSIYTLAIKPEIATSGEPNPKTFDGITFYGIIGIISLLGLSGTCIYFKKDLIKS